MKAWVSEFCGDHSFNNISIKKVKCPSKNVILLYLLSHSEHVNFSSRDQFTVCFRISPNRQLVYTPSLLHLLVLLIETNKVWVGFFFYYFLFFLWEMALK